MSGLDNGMPQPHLHRLVGAIEQFKRSFSDGSNKRNNSDFLT